MILSILKKNVLDCIHFNVLILLFSASSSHRVVKSSPAPCVSRIIFSIVSKFFIFWHMSWATLSLTCATPTQYLNFLIIHKTGEVHISKLNSANGWLLLNDFFYIFIFIFQGITLSF